MAGKCVVEIDGQRNECVVFSPLGRSLRGTLRFDRFGETEACRLIPEFPSGVPGQRIEVDWEAGTAAVVEPLAAESAAPLRDRLGRKLGVGGGGRLDVGPEREPIPAENVEATGGRATWAYWLRRLVEAGLATVTAGTIPTGLTGEIRKRFNSPPEPESPEERTARLAAESLDFQRRDHALKLAMMTPQQRKEYERLLAETP